MKHQTTLITGANSGIGKAAALQFAQAGHTLIMGCRDVARSAAAQQEIIAASGNDKVHLMAVDMSSFASIRAFCQAFGQQFPRLDVLIHNAAYFEHGADYRLSPDGIELAFATNVVGPYLMTQLLLEQLQQSEDARVLNASSNIVKHFFSPSKEIEFGILQCATPPKKHRVYDRYRDSKMALVMLTFKMAEAFREAGIKVNALQVNGAKMSKATLKKFKMPWRLIAYVQNLFFPPVEYMADRYFQLCTAERFRTATGQLFNDKLEAMRTGPDNPKPTDVWGTSVYPAYADRQEVQEKIWDLCAEWTGIS